MDPTNKVLISFTGRNLIEVNFAPAEAAKKKAYRRVCNKAKAAGNQLPPEGDGQFVRATEGEALSLKPGTTATVTEEELAFIKSDYPVAFRCITVHPGVAGKPSRVERKAAKEKAAKERGSKPEPEPVFFTAPLSPEGSKGKRKGKGSKPTVSTG